MIGNKNVLLILAAVVFNCSLFVFAVSGNPKETGIKKLTVADLKEFLLLPSINVSDYNSKDVQLPDLDNLVGFGDFAQIARPKPSGILSSPPPFFDFAQIPRPESLNSMWSPFLHVCSPDLSVFQVYIAKPKSFDEASDLIYQRAVAFISNPSVIPGICIPKIENGQYSLVRETVSRIELTRFSVQRGVLIGVDFLLHHPMQTPEAQYNREALLAQMNVLTDDLISWVDGNIKMTDEKEEYYNNLKSVYKSAVPDPVIVEERPRPSIWGDD